MTLPTLYKVTATGASQYWTISVDGATYTTEYGQVGTESPQFQSTTAVGMNIGRSNETTPEQQALAEATSLHTKRIERQGYSLEPNQSSANPLAMKVKVWTPGKLPPKVAFPLLSTVKLNGVNGTYIRTDGALTLYSRTGTVFPSIPHLEPAIQYYMDHFGCNQLNGELFIPSTHLQDITSAVKATKPSSANLEFHVFNIPDTLVTYATVQAAFINCEPHPDTYVHLIVPVWCESHAELESHFQLAMANGMEGTVIYHPSATYQPGIRSNRIWKYKVAQEAEFLVTYRTLDKANHPIYHCDSPGGAFKVKRKGTAEERLADALIDHTGEWLTVEFECYSKAGKPTKPVGLQFRDCDQSGQPLI